MKLRDPGEPPDGPSRTSSDDFPAPLPIPLTPLASLETIPAEDSGITFADSSAKAPPKPAGILFRPPSFQVKRPHGPFEPPSDDDEPGSGGFDESDTSSEASDESSEDEGPLEPTTALGKLGHRLVSFFWRHFSFRMLHWTFFILLLFILTGFICISKGDPETPFVDLLFVVSAAITGSGIIPIPMEALNYYQQAVIFVGMIMGSLTFMSLLPVIMRRRYLLEAINYLEQKHARAAEKHKESLRSLGDPENGNGSAKQRRKSRFDRSTTAPDRLERGVSPTPSKKVRRNTIFQPPGWPYVPSDPDVPLAPIMATRVDSAVAAPGRVIKFAEPKAPALFELDHLSLHGNLVRRRTIASPDVAKEAMASLRKAGRRLSIAHLARHKRLPTAVPELDALNYLIVFVLVYQLLPALFCAFISCMYLINDPDFRTTIQQSSASATPPHLPPVQANPYWFAVFAMFSGFTNAGMMTVSAGASLFLNGGGGPIPYFIVWLTFMGFVLSPLWLRYLTILIRWIEARRLGRTGKEEGLGMRRKTIVGDGGLNAFLNAPEKKSSRLLDALDFLLEHPRRVYTLMFRPAETRWIGFVNIGVTVVGFLIYLVMEWNDPAKLGLTTGRSWDFWFNGWVTRRPSSVAN